MDAHYKGFPGSSAGKESASNAGDAVQPLGWEAAHGGANGNPSSILA